MDIPPYPFLCPAGSRVRLCESNSGTPMLMGRFLIDGWSSDK